MAAALNRVGLGTLLVDLLTADEELSRAYVFNIAMLAGSADGNYPLAARPARRRHSPVRLLRGEHRRPTASAGAGAHPAAT